MSEYQYYEFQAIDQPLSDEDMAALRSITSRAEITPTSLINVYHYGDFRGNPRKLMEQYFDAHLYTANWGTNRLMLRLPASALPLSAVEPYCTEQTLDAREAGGNVILDFTSNIEDWRGDFEGGEGWLASLLPLRADLMSGDLRCLYIAWLSGVENGELDEEEEEPPVPPGMGKLSGALRRFYDFMRVSPHLIDVAAEASDKAAKGPSTEEMSSWLAGLPSGDKDALLLRLMQGEGVVVSGELLREFRTAWAKANPVSTSTAGRRTAGDLFAKCEEREQEEERREAERAAKERARREKEQAAARERKLDSLVGQELRLWREVEAAVLTKLPKEYDRAVELLKDLRDLAGRSGKQADFNSSVRELRERHRAKRTLLERLDKAGLGA
jgi:hypothetical protein